MSAMPRVTSDRTARAAGFRYGVVFLVTFGLVVFEIAAPDRAWAQAVALGLQGVALTVVVATSRARAGIRRARALAVGGAGAVAVALVGAGVLSEDLVLAIGGLLAAAIPAALAGASYDSSASAESRCERFSAR